MRKEDDCMEAGLGEAEKSHDMTAVGPTPCPTHTL